MGWVLAGAIPGLLLADLGAEVIKIESRSRLDYMRQGRPVIGTRRDPEQNPMFHNVARSKLSLTLDLSRPEAVALLKDLVRVSDILIENFSPGVMERLGLGYEDLRRVRPDLVMASMSAAGHQGPLRDLRAYAPSINALAGLDSMVGYEGGRPLGLKHAYGDICAGLHLFFAIVAALHHRERTGEGVHIRLSMLRATTVTLGQALLDYQMTGRVPGPRGNFDPSLAPYNFYRCAGEDEWVAIAVGTEEEWRGLCRALGDPPWTRDPRFADRARRLQNRKDLDRRIEEWTGERSKEEVFHTLQRHGVPCTPLLRATERLFDPHFRERGLYREVDHPALGVEPVFSLMWKMEKTPPLPPRRAPLLGEHTHYILEEVLGLPPGEVACLEESKVVH